MGKGIVKGSNSSTHPLPAVFDHFGLKGIQPSDDLSLTLRNGILEATVKRASGPTQKVTLHLGSGGGFKAMTEFDASSMPKSDRNDLIRSMHAKGERQSALAKTFGLSQAMVSKIVRD